VLEYLVESRAPVALTDLAKTFGTSKATVYRHLQALVKHGFARQDEVTSRYEAGIKLLLLGEALRERYSILSCARAQMSSLREATGQAISLSALINDEVVILELLQGRTVVEFGIRPGTRMDLHATAHGKTALAFGPAHLLDDLLASPLKKWTSETVTSASLLKIAIKAVQKQGWATAADGIVWGVNGLAAPVFDHRNQYAGAIAIIGSVHDIPDHPSKELIELVIGAAGQISRSLGYTKT